MSKMMQPSYEGDSPYIFVSYCDQDLDKVSPMIRLMEENGYRIWHDQGMDSNVPWSYEMTEHLDQCSVFLAFISGNYMAFHGCRKGFNLAVMEKKPMLCVMLEAMNVTPVMKMQMESACKVDYESCSSKWECFRRMIQMKEMDLCKEDEKTVLLPKHIVREFYLNRRTTSERILLDKEAFSMGRNIRCDYVISDNRTVSKVHAIFYIGDGQCAVYDNHSTNKVYVNDRKLEDEERCVLKHGDVIEIGSEKFVVEIAE